MILFVRTLLKRIMEGNGSSDEEELLDERRRDEREHDGTSEEEEQHFDISLAASHSYMGSGLVAVRGRALPEPGWRGRVPVIAHHGAVFPGETVPMLLVVAHDVAVIMQVVDRDRLFGLLCPDETGAMVSGYGVLCEVFEWGAAGGSGAAPANVSFKARATHRFRCRRPARASPLHAYARMRFVDVQVLPEVRPGDPLRPVRLASLDARRGASPCGARVRGLDAAVTPWPPFVYDICDYGRMRRTIQEYFESMALGNLPEEPVSLSFWTASNLPLSARDRLALFAVDDALLRLHMEVRLIMRKSILCCASCVTEIARREDIFAMSSEGVHSNYTNLGGYVHDVVTVARASNTQLSGAPSDEFSWFPGYSWTVALCAACMAHVGWRFDALRRNLRPQQFYGLCRNYVQPHCDDERPLSPPPLRSLADELRSRRAVAELVYVPPMARRGTQP